MALPPQSSLLSENSHFGRTQTKGDTNGERFCLGEVGRNSSYLPFHPTKKCQKLERLPYAFYVFFETKLSTSVSCGSFLLSSLPTPTPKGIFSMFSTYSHQETFLSSAGNYAYFNQNKREQGLLYVVGDLSPCLLLLHPV